MLKARGFTLLEIMLVLVLLGMISVGVVMTLPSSVGLDKDPDWHAQRFSSLLQFVQDSALISNREMGIEFGEQEYTFAVYDFKEKKWLPLVDNRITGKVELPPTIRGEYLLSGSVWGEIGQQDVSSFIDDEDRIQISGEEEEIKINPQVFIMSSGEVTPFSYQFSYEEDQNKNPILVNVSMSGQIDISSEAP